MKKFLTLVAMVALFSVVNSVRAEDVAKAAPKTKAAPAAASAGQLTLKFDAPKAEGELSGRGGRGFGGGRGYGGGRSYGYGRGYGYGYGRGYGYGGYSSYGYGSCYYPSYSYCYYPSYSYCYSPCYSYYSCCGSIGTLSAGNGAATTSTVERANATLTLPASLSK
ncbi:MAG: hypothetical protein K2R98_33325 [Gemmataceae bacterium]|nr:hypothetical protein [Gemmataceae bacterium]